MNSLCFSPPRRRGLLLLAAVLTLLQSIPMASKAERMLGMGPDNDSLPFARLSRLKIPVLDIVTIDSVWPTCDYVSAPEGAWGQSITNATKVPGRMRMTLGDSILYDTGEWVADESGMTIKIRGNSSAYYDKKPYKIKLQKKADLLMRDTIDHSDKNWLLICDETFKTMMGFELNRLLGMPWTPGYRYVNVVINGQYEGIYMLVESVRRNTDCRINVSKTGFIFESDPYWWNEPLYIHSLQWSTLRFTFKYPEPEDMTDDDVAYMTSLLYDMERSYARDYYPTLLDVHSFAAWCLGHDILMTKDYAGTNRYYCKADRSDTTKIFMPLMWDFDSTEADTVGWSPPHICFFRSLFNNPDRTFVEQYVTLWRQVSPTLYDTLNTLFTTLRKSPEGSGISYSLQYNNNRWGSKYLVYSSFLYRPQWIQKRSPWLTREINKLNPPGDIDFNGTVDVTDINRLLNMLLEYEPAKMSVADINHDGKLDVADVNAAITIVLEGTAQE